MGHWRNFGTTYVCSRLYSHVTLTLSWLILVFHFIWKVHRKRAPRDLSGRLTPIGIDALPNEILCRIFSYHRLDTKVMIRPFISLSNSHYVLEPSKCPTLFVILLVCRRWRATGLAYAHLWTILIPNNHALLLFMLKYSKNCALFFGDRMSLDSFTYLERRNLLMNNLHRIRVLDLILRPEIGMGPCLDLVHAFAVSDAAPQLDILKFSLTDHFGLTQAIALKISLLPPSLTSLTLRECVFIPVLDCPPFIHLTHFCLEEDLRRYRRSSRGIPLYDALDKMPNLTHLTFRHGTYDLIGQPEPLPRTRPVDLPHLQSFEFYGTSAYYLYILPNLSFPPSVIRNIHLAECPPHLVPHFSGSMTKLHRITSLERICNGLCDAFDNWRLSQAMARTYQVKFSLKSTVLGIEESLQLKAVVTSRLPVQDSTNPEELDVFTFQLDDYSDEMTDVLEIFSSISNFFPAHIVDSFHFETNFIHRKLETWEPPLLDWEEVRDVRVEGTGAARWLIPFLAEVYEDEHSDQESKGETAGVEGTNQFLGVFPMMTNLSLNGISMPEFYTGDISATQLDWGRAMEMLRARARLSEGVEKGARLGISKCRVREWRVKEVVKKGWIKDGMLVWDGDEGEDEC